MNNSSSYYTTLRHAIEQHKKLLISSNSKQSEGRKFDGTLKRKFKKGS